MKLKEQKTGKCLKDNTFPMPHDTILGFFLNPTLLVILFIFYWALNCFTCQSASISNPRIDDWTVWILITQSLTALLIALRVRGRRSRRGVLSSAGVLTIERKHELRQLKDVTFLLLFTFCTIYINNLC